MKVTIAIKKTEPFKKLFVKTVEKEMFEKIKSVLKNKGAPIVAKPWAVAVIGPILVAVIDPADRKSVV